LGFFSTILFAFLPKIENYEQTVEISEILTPTFKENLILMLEVVKMKKFSFLFP
jgi:hypothetical protein